jgi:hypothetical protein
MKINFTLVPLGVLGLNLCFAGSALAQPPLTPPTADCPATIDDIAHCPDIGCGENGDRELNKAKNRTDIPTDSDVKTKTFANMRALAQPARWDTGQDRATIRTAGKEGTPVEMMGFLFKVKKGGAESCNCDLSRGVNTDLHLVLLKDMDQGEATSVTAEITPRIRANGHSDWIFKNVNDLEGEFVRVTGWLMLDTKHIRQAHFLPNERLNTGFARSTNWEIHPVTKLEVCEKSVSACKAGQGWKEFRVP